LANTVHFKGFYLLIYLRNLVHYYYYYYYYIVMM